MRALNRPLHPGAWWLWALGLAAAASRTTNPLLLALILAVTGYVVASRRPSAPWVRAYGVFLRLALAVLLIRVVLRVLFGPPTPGTTLVALPSVALPEWAAGVRVGGEITAEGVATAAYDGLRLATLLACIGAANALASSSRLLRALPGALYEVGVAIVVALTFAPQAVMHVQRVRAARRLRGRPDRGLRGLRRVAMPVVEGALERSLELAAAMDARGFGRTAGLHPGTRRITGALILAGLLGTCAGTYGLLDSASPPLLGLPLFLAGIVTAGAGFALGGRRSRRSRYRPDPWTWPEWAVTASGAAAVAAVLATAVGELTTLHPSTNPLTLPALPLLPVAGVLLALAPSWLAPRPVPQPSKGAQ